MNEHLAGLFSYTLPYHVGLFWAVLACSLIYLALTQFGRADKGYVLKIRYFLPLYHALLAGLIFTGLVLSSAYDFALNLRTGKDAFSQPSSNRSKCHRL